MQIRPGPRMPRQKKASTKPVSVRNTEVGNRCSASARWSDHMELLKELSLPTQLFLGVVALSALRIVYVILAGILRRVASVISALAPQKPKPQKATSDYDEVTK